MPSWLDVVALWHAVIPRAQRLSPLVAPAVRVATRAPCGPCLQCGNAYRTETAAVLTFVRRRNPICPTTVSCIVSRRFLLSFQLNHFKFKLPTIARCALTFQHVCLVIGLTPWTHTYKHPCTYVPSWICACLREHSNMQPSFLRV